MIVGIDEVGRGCIAGPVCAGVVIFNPEKIDTIHLYKDSKTISEIKRDEIFTDITTKHYFSLGWASVQEIDEINIRQASLLAMKRAFLDFQNKYKSLIDFSKVEIQVDGRDIIPNLGGYTQLSVIKGDQKVREISAASIIAKVSRDRLMKEISLTFKEYSFDQHKGYGTEEHRRAIELHGVTVHHRKTFGGVKEHL